MGRNRRGARAPDYVSRMAESKTPEGDGAARRSREDGEHEILYTLYLDPEGREQYTKFTESPQFPAIIGVQKKRQG